MANLYVFRNERMLAHCTRVSDRCTLGHLFEVRFDLGTLDSGEQSLPFGLLVTVAVAMCELTSIHITSETQLLYTGPSSMLVREP